MALDLDLILLSEKGMPLTSADHDSNLNNIQTGINVLDTQKVDISDVLTPVPEDALFTDTTYIIGAGGLTEVNYTEADKTLVDTIPDITLSEENYTSADKALVDTIPDISTAAGDMFQSVYDPAGAGADIYDVDNHVSGTQNKVFTVAEQSKLAAVTPGAQINTVDIDAVNTFTRAQRGQLHDIAVISNNVAIDLSLENRFKVATLTADVSIANPTNVAGVQGGTLYIPQDATGGHQIAWGSHWVFPNITLPAYTASAVGMYAYEVYEPDKIIVSYIGEI